MKRLLNKKTLILFSVIMSTLIGMSMYYYIKNQCLGNYSYYKEEISEDTYVVAPYSEIERSIDIDDSLNIESLSLFLVHEEADDINVKITIFGNEHKIVDRIITEKKDVITLDINTENISHLVIKIENLNSKDFILKGHKIDDQILFSVEINASVPHYIYTLVKISICLLIILMIVTSYFIFIKKERIEKIFLIAVFILGFIYMAVFTPSTIPDEQAHIRNTLGFSSIVMGKGTRENIVIRESEMYGKNNQPSINAIMQYKKDINLMDSKNKYIKTDIILDDGFKMITYVPGIIGVTLARLLSLDGILTIYIGRLFNLLFYAFATYISIKKIPIFKKVLFFVSLLPMSIHQAISLSYDTTILGCSWIVIAYSLFFIYGKEKIKRQDILIFIIFSSILTFQKGGFYILLNFLPILIGKNRVVDRKDRISLKAILLVPWIVSLLIPVLLNTNLSRNVVGQKNIVNWAGTEGYSISYFMTHIKETILLFVKTIYLKGNYYIYGMLGQFLGSINIILNNLLFSIWIIIGLVSPYALDAKEKELFLEVNVKHKLCYNAIFIIIVFLSMLAMAISFTPIGWPTIEGVQGRYFLSAFPLLLIGLSIRKININKNFNNLFIVLVLVCQIFTTFNILTACLK